MDTLTHALSGALLARLMTVRTPVAATVAAAAPAHDPAPPLWACVTVGAVAAAFPDIDFVTSAGGPVFYLQHHRGITHSVLLLPLWACLVAWIMAKLLPPTRPLAGAWKRLLPIAAGGIALHLAGDWITQFGTQLLAPLSDHRFDLGAVFIIDLALSATLVAGLLLAAVWPRRRWPAALGLLAAIGWIGLCWTGRQEALAAGHQQAQRLGIAAPLVQVMPRPASPFNWTVTVLDPAADTYHLAHLNTRRTEPMVAGPDANFIRRFSAPYQPLRQARWQRLPRFGGAGEPAWVQAVWQHPDFAFYRWFAMTPALADAGVRPGPQGQRQRCASFRDLRFEFPGRDAAPFRYGLCLGGDGSGGASADAAAPARRFRIVDGEMDRL